MNVLYSEIYYYHPAAIYSFQQTLLAGATGSAGLYD